MTKKQIRADKRIKRKAAKRVKRENRKLAIAKFFEFKFLGIRKALKISKTRKTIKALTLAVLWAIPAILLNVGFILGTITSGTILVWVSLDIVMLYLFGPKALAVLSERAKARHELAIEKANAFKWYINKKQAKNTAKMAKNHSKWSRKGAKGQAKIDEAAAKAKAKEDKLKAKEEAAKRAQNEHEKFIGKLEQEVNTLNINKR